jgi:hypothetical protein
MGGAASEAARLAGHAQFGEQPAVSYLIGFLVIQSQ